MVVIPSSWMKSGYYDSSAVEPNGTIVNSSFGSSTLQPTAQSPTGSIHAKETLTLFNELAKFADSSTPSVVTAVYQHESEESILVVDLWSIPTGRVNSEIVEDWRNCDVFRAPRAIGKWINQDLEFPVLASKNTDHYTSVWINVRGKTRDPEELYYKISFIISEEIPLFLLALNQQWYPVPVASFQLDHMNISQWRELENTDQFYVNGDTLIGSTLLTIRYLTMRVSYA